MKAKSKITLENGQIKSDAKFKAVANAIDLLEIETFIGSGLICLSGMFICPDINLLKFYQEGTPTERLLALICIGLHVKRYGKQSRKDYLAIEAKDRQARSAARVRAKVKGKTKGSKRRAKQGK